MAQPLTTDQPDLDAPAAARAVARDFLLARLGSLFAILPLGVWTLNHLWNQLAAYDSPEAWETSVTGHSSPASTALTFAVVLVPLLWHTAWGIGRMLRSRPDVRVTWFSNLRYIVQRLSAIGLLFFLGAHLYLAWFEPRFLQGHAELFPDISRQMRFHTPTLVVYLLGVLAIAYHLANGLWSFLSMGWGAMVSKAGIAWLERFALLFFFVLLAIGWAAVYGLYVGGEAYGPL
jgi:succinate dehydrogenase / fumarate reductase cytochrome b subunit